MFYFLLKWCGVEVSSHIFWFRGITKKRGQQRVNCFYLLLILSIFLVCVFLFCWSWRCGSYPCNLLFALGTVRSVSLIMALGTEDRPSLLEEAPLIQHHLTLWTRKLLWVPRTSKRHQVPTPGKHTNTSRLQQHFRDIFKSATFKFQWGK